MGRRRRQAAASGTVKPAILAVDQGTTSTRAVVFDESGMPVGSAQEEFARHYPRDGWVEQDPEDLWRTTVNTCTAAIDKAAASGFQPVAMGITNQRETVVLWERASGRPLAHAIVWQDRRTAKTCLTLRDSGHADDVAERTGLLLDPYFSATKIAWLLDNIPGARARAHAGELAVGTVDSFLMWRLTEGERHVTDATNASRTSLYNIHQQEWDSELLRLFDVPEALLPEVLDCNGEFGVARIGDQRLPILGVAGDQQAATIGQCCFTPGSIKSTYGTGCFVMLNTGDEPVVSQHRLLTTIAYRIDGRTTYALEGSIFTAGAAVQWLRDSMKLVDNAAETEGMAASVPDNHGVYLVPAFTGLGAPHWDPDARGMVCGLTMDAGREHLVRAALESVVYQTHDLFAAMAQDGIRPHHVRVDGGMVHNTWLCQFLSDILDVEVERPKIMETTVLGAASLAGMKQGLYPEFPELGNRWQEDSHYRPRIDASERETLLSGWNDAVRRALSHPA